MTRILLAICVLSTLAPALQVQVSVVCRSWVGKPQSVDRSLSRKPFPTGWSLSPACNGSIFPGNSTASSRQNLLPPVAVSQVHTAPECYNHTLPAFPHQTSHCLLSNTPTPPGYWPECLAGMGNRHRVPRKVFHPDDKRNPDRRLPTRMCPDVSLALEGVRLPGWWGAIGNGAGFLWTYFWPCDQISSIILNFWLFAEGIIWISFILLFLQ